MIASHPKSNYSYERQCMGCYRTDTQILEEENIDGDLLDDNAITTNSGEWYCHTDCY